MNAPFAVTYEILAPDADDADDADERGYIAESETLRSALKDLFSTRTCHVAGVVAVEPSDNIPQASRWLTVYNGMEYQTGARESRTLFRPAGVTSASWTRILKLCGVTK